MSIVSWFMLGVVILIIALNIWITLKIVYQDHKIKKIEKKRKKSLDNKN